MELFLLPETWIALLTLAFLEVVLGVDNVIFISIVTNKLPENQRQKARNIGLLLALVLRVGLLLSISWLIHHLTNPLFELFGKDFSVREIILAIGGLFLLAKSTSEIHEKMYEHDHEEEKPRVVTLSRVVFQIIMLDIVFSFDSILTAVGLTDHVIIMIIAVIISVIIMVLFSGKISSFINNNPTLEILALSFLILIGFMLVLEGVHIEVPKGYIYFAVFFSLIVETININMRKRRKRLKKIAASEVK